VDALEDEMQKAAQRMDFEKAAELRDMIQDLRKTLKPTRSFTRGARSRVVSTIDPKADVAELQEALGLENPPLVMECFDIANIGTAHCVASMVRFRNGVPDNANYRRYRIRAVTGQNDFVSMAEVVRRRYSRILLEGREQLGEEADFSQESVVDAMRRLEQTNPPDPEPDGPVTFEETELPDGSTTQLRPEPQRKSENVKRNTSRWVRLPDLIIVDGGKGQLGVAVAELQRLGLGGLPIIGLAKERVEIFFPGESEALVLPHETGALKLLQRIRDEAHRWANGYHQMLLKRRVAESLLDDCPGISQTRKAALLKVFGSVQRLRKAGVEDIAKVPGIGSSLAEVVVRFLADLPE